MNKLGRKSGKQSHLQIASSKIKYLAITLNKEAKDFYIAKFKILKKWDKALEDRKTPRFLEL